MSETFVFICTQSIVGKMFSFSQYNNLWHRHLKKTGHSQMRTPLSPLHNPESYSRLCIISRIIPGT